MSDRDIPSVPVTTLAGLTSLSDLLSELPVSDSISSVSSLNKSLLFHTLVAEEANNILSVRDDNLARQLVQAIEQTNADNIELKSQYAITQHGTNISEYPELLQGIYTFRPTVFNTPNSNRIQNHQLRSTQTIEKKDVQSISLNIDQNHGIAQPHPSFTTTTRQKAQTITIPQNANNCSLQMVSNLPINQSIENLNTVSRTDIILSGGTDITNKDNIYKQNEKIVSNKNIKHSNINNPQIIVQSKPDENMKMNENQFIIKPNQGIITENIFLSQQQSLQNQITNSQILYQQQPQQQIQNSIEIKNITSQQQQPQQIQHINLKVIEENYGQHTATQQSNLEFPQLHEQQQHPHQFPSHFLQSHGEIIENKCNANMETKTDLLGINIMSSESCEQIDFESQIDNTIANSSSQQCNSTTIRSATRVDQNPTILLPKVCLTKLKIEDEILMQQSLKKFAKKSPELAKKMGLSSPIKLDNKISKPDTIILNPDPIISKPDTIISKPDPIISKPDTIISKPDAIISKSVDMFTVMKEDERRSASKRKIAVKNDDIPPEEIFTKPKLRRVERAIAPVVKTSKEEILKSQTYQQFMKNIEHIIEQLDDTEQPNFNADETDENIESISSKMLTVISNDVAKLKAKGVLDSIPKNKLTLLINYAMRNVYIARNYSVGPDVDEDMIGDEVMEKVLNAIEACLLICNIYSTAKDLKFLQEDNISSIIKFVQFQFRETIFPSFDPVYTVKNMKKSSTMDNRKKNKSQNSHNRNLQLFYSKSVELMKVFVTLFDKCIFVDTIVLPLSTLAIEPFFVDNVETLQFVCLELVTTIFRKEQYVKMRSSILGDILASIDRLPCSKKNLRPFKLANNGGNIQMVTALVLQLIQCATVLPESICGDHTNRNNRKIKSIDLDENLIGAKSPADKDLIVLEKYDTAVSIGGNFLTTFLSKCKTRSNETDFRPLFENFIHDLLSTVNKPEWPAAELLLSLLGTLLVKYMSDKSIEQSIRLASLDYLGIVAARLRKDTVESRCKVNTMDQMIKCIKAEQEKEGDFQNNNANIVIDPEEERIEFLQKILLDFLAVNGQEENLIWDYARHFYLTQWYRDVMQQRKRIAEGENSYASRKKKAEKNSRKKKTDVSSESSSEDSSDDDNDSLKNIKSRINYGPDQGLNLEIFHVLDDRKKYLLNKIKPYSELNSSQHIKTYIDYNNAHLIAQYLAGRRPFSQSFDKYLQKIILVVREPAIAIRTRAMKCLANIVEVDPLILKRKDMQMGVNQKFLDTAISVREAAVDLIGKYVLSSEDLIDQYYDMLSKRILDTGVSVRKRVIKILRDICIEYPDFDKIPDICVKMIRRVNDEEGIQKLVTEVFMRMWFTPCANNDRIGVQRKINQIIDVVNSAHDTGTLWLDGLLNSIFAPKEIMQKIENSSEPIKKNTEPAPEVVLACQQLANGLTERLIELEDTDNTRMLGCITTIHLLAKVRPQLLVRHAITIEPYLNIKCHSTIAPKFICSVAEILEQVVPLMEHPSDSFLADLEGHLMMLVVSLNQTVVASCLSCLGAVVNKITKNYKLIRDCFSKFYKSIYTSREQLLKNPTLPIDNIYQPIFRRSLYTIGILMRFFDFKSPKVLGLDEGDKIQPNICDEVFESLMYFITCPNLEIRKQALVSLGHFCVQNDEYLTRSELRDFYCDLLKTSTVQPHIKLICMRNIWMYLTESEIYMHNKEKDWASQAQHDDLKEMNDVSSGMASRIIQLYLTEILNCFLHPDCAVRLWAVKVIQIVLRQGLVHPVRMVPYLISLSTDEKQETAHRSDALLKEIDKTYSGFVNMKIQSGLELSFQLQDILQCKGNAKVLRGYVKRENNQVVSLNDFLYTLLRNTKPQRRALVLTVTKQFDDQKTTLRQMLYLADNLAYFPYVVQDEPLYLIHQIDLMVSVAGTNLLASFKEGLKQPENSDINDEKDKVLEDDDDDEDKDVLFNRLPDDTCELQQCITSAQGCMLMLILKQHLKDMYGITDGKISRYSPSEPQKIYEKAISRKSVADFQPKSTIQVIQKGDDISKKLNDDEKRDLIDKYLDFKQLMLRLDPDDPDSNDEEKSKLPNTTNQLTPKSTKTPGLDDSLEEENIIDQKSHVNSNNESTATTGGPKQDSVLSTPPAQRQTKSSKSFSARKQSTRNKKKKRKISDDDESDYSDEDYQ